MHRLLTTLPALALAAFSLAQANTKFNLINDPYYGVPSFSRNYVNRVLKDVNDIYGKEISGLGPTGLRTEFMLTNWLGLGTDVIYNQASGEFYRLEIDGYVAGQPIYNEHKYVVTLNRTRIQARVNFHIPVKGKRIDWYGGIAFGSNTMKTTLTRDGKETDNVDDVSPRIPYLGISARSCLGFRYYPTKFVGVHFELGGGGPLFTTGVSTRFGFKLPSMPEQFKSDGLKEKADQLQKESDEQQKQLERGKNSESGSESGSEKTESARARAEQERLESERRQLEEERKALEEERRKLEEEKKKSEEPD